MGIRQSRVASVLSDPSKGDSPFAVRRHPDFADQIMMNPPSMLTMQDLFKGSVAKYADKPYLGIRPQFGGRAANEYVFQTYSECAKISYDFGSGLSGLGITQKKMVGIYSENCPDWVLAVDASSLYGFVLVSLYDTLGPDSLEFMIEQTWMEAILVSPKNLEKTVDIMVRKPCGVRYIIVMGDAIPLPVTEMAAPIKILTFDSICKEGEKKPVILPHIEAEDPYYICYSSGTTGNPKGVIVPQRAAVSNCLSVSYEVALGENCRYLSYLPLAHIFERSAKDVVCYQGGRIGFNSGGVQKLLDDMTVLKPTMMAAVPRVMNRIYDAINTKLKSSSLISRGIFWCCWEAKKMFLQRGLSTSLFDLIAFDPLKRKLGGCVKNFVIGGAAMDPSIHDFLQVSFGVPLRCGYGLTEGGINSCHKDSICDCLSRTVGGPLPNSEIRLEPIQGFDDPKCGEILIGGQGLSLGYLKDELATNALFIDEKRKWIHTGDVGKWNNQGHLLIVDRMRSIFKLSQGEYVAAEFLTQIYERAEFVKQIFIYGDSMRPSLIAIIVPNRDDVARFFGKDKMTDEEFSLLCEDPNLKAEILRKLNEMAKKNKLFGYQYIRAIDLEPREWTNEITPTFKMKRKMLQERYTDTIEELYAKLK